MILNLLKNQDFLKHGETREKPNIVTKYCGIVD